MAYRIITVVGLLLIPLSVLSEEWKDTYSAEIEPRVQKELKIEKKNEQCTVDLPLLLEKLAENPQSEFLKFKVEELTKICQ